MTNDSQKVRDILGWAQNMPEAVLAVLAMMALTDLVGALEKRLTALEAAKPQDGSSASCDEMLDMLLLSNADKRADNAHLTAEVKRERERNAALVAEVARLNTFLAQQADPDKAILAEALKERTAELSFMNQRRDALAAELGDRIKERKTAWAEVDALIAERNTLAAQVDDLRNINAGLRAALGTAADKIRRPTEGFYALEAQRIALSDPAPCTGTGSGGCDCLPDDEA